MHRHAPRKLAVILHVDVVGSTGLVRRDETLAHERIQDAFRRAATTMAAYGGTALEQRGDAIVAEFERGSDAVCAAGALQAANASFNAGLDDPVRPQLRVGISIGEVIVADDTVTGPGVVVAQRLEQLAPPDGVCIQGAVQETLPQWLPFEFQCLGERSLKGFDETVRAYLVQLKAGEAVPSPESSFVRTPPPAWWHRRAVVGALAASVLAGAAAASWWWRLQVPADQSAPLAGAVSPDREAPSIAVLPFTNMSEDTEQRYFADGMTDDLITDLTRISGLRVIARDSAFFHRDDRAEPRQVAEALGVRYLLLGSVRRSGSSVRINASLVDTSSGTNLWAERYDSDLTDMFAVQDSLNRRIAAALAVELTRAEDATLGRRDTADLRAYEYFLQARDRYYHYSRENTSEAQSLFEKAIERDPRFARAYAMLALTYWFEFSNGWGGNAEASLERASTLARQALSLRDDLPVAHFVLGLVHRERREYVTALAEAEKAIALDPNYANGRVLLATVLYYTGRAEEGLREMEEAARLNPHHPHNYQFHLGQAHFILGRYERAIDYFKSGLLSNPTSERLHLWLVAAYAVAGQMDDAQWELQQVLDSDPDFSLRRIQGAYPFMYNADLENFLDALRMANAPE